MAIQNKKALLDNACSSKNRRSREILLDALEKALDAVDPRKMIMRNVVIEENLLRLGERVFDLTSFGRMFVIGAGKASGRMAEALEEILGERIEKGFVIVPRGTSNRYSSKKIDFHESSHPIPDEKSVEGAKKLLDLVSSADKKDVFICLISGGGSSLMALPRPEISLEDKRKVTDLLLRSGATINELNAVRKHLSGIKGGLLAKKAYPATVITLLLSDVIGDPLDVIASGPTVPDLTTFGDAILILRKYHLWEKIPNAVSQVLGDGAGGFIPETPKPDDEAFAKTCNIIIGNNRSACFEVIRHLKNSGLSTLLLSSLAEGEARDIGLMLGAMANEIAASRNPSSPPIGIVIGGETTVTVTGYGKGGRNQEIGLAAALKIKGLENTTIVSISTDGIDGPTDAAGAIVDGNTIQISEKSGLDAKKHLEDNDSYSFFSKIGGLVFTGPTGTNVNDLSILLVPE